MGIVVQQPKIQEELHQCKWLDCTIIFETAEKLYEHITSTHIGRKSAGTLSLECKWAGCNSKASKRDHLTSHARVHINLKPHTCNICSKSFKRPQDLKKHEKIHTEEHHVNHKQSKAVTVGGNAPAGAPVKSNDKAHTKQHLEQMQMPQSHLQHAHHLQQQQQQQQQQQAQQQMFSQAPPFYHFGLPLTANIDMATLIAQQQQLNAQASAGFPMAVQGLPGMHPAFQFGVPGAPAYPGLPTSQAHQAAQLQAYQQYQQQLFAAHSAFPFGPVPFTLAPPGHSTSVRDAPAANSLPVSTASTHLPTPAPVSSLYPALPSAFSSNFNIPAVHNTSNGLATPAPLSGHMPSHNSPHVKQEDNPSPASSAQSHRSRQGYSSSVSPRVPALSPPSISSPENTYSPPSEAESNEEAYRRSISGNAVAGKKRGFEEAAGVFVQDLKNKRFFEEDQLKQIDNLANFYFSPEVNNHVSLTPARSHDGSSAASIASDLASNQEEVEQINELLLSLGQTLENGDSTDSTFPSLNGQALQQEAAFQHYTGVPPAYENHSLYPSLPAQTSFSGVPRHSRQTYEHDFSRLAKSVAPPTINNDYKLPTLTTVNRLNKAAPVSTSFRDHVRSESMDEDHAAHHSKRQVSSLRSTSFDEPSVPQALEDAHMITLPPIRSGLPLVSSSVHLPPILSANSTSPPRHVTLPSIGSLIERTDRDSSVNSSSSASGSSTPSRSSLYPTFPKNGGFVIDSSASSRPQSSGGTVERLAHRVHKLTMSPESNAVGSGSLPSALAATAPALVESSDTESDDDENDPDRPSSSKKSRVESPEVMDLEDLASAAALRSRDDSSAETEMEDAAVRHARRQQEEIKRRRLEVVRMLVVLVNAQYRQKLLVEAATKQQQQHVVESSDVVEA